MEFLDFKSKLFVFLKNENANFNNFVSPLRKLLIIFQKKESKDFDTPTAKKIINSLEFDQSSMLNLRNEWLSFRINIDRTYGGSEKIKIDNHFLWHYGNSLSSFDKLNTELYRNLQQLRTNESLEAHSDNLGNIAKIIRFHQNTVLSRMRHYLYKELACSTKTAPNHDYDPYNFDTYLYIINKIILLTKVYLNKRVPRFLKTNRVTKNIVDKHIIHKLQKSSLLLGFNMVLSHEFIFSSNDYKTRGFGKFLKFKFNHETFKKCTKILLEKKNLIEFRDIKPITENILIENLTSIHNISNESLTTNNVFDYSINIIKGEMYVEPYSRYLFVLIWKLRLIFKQAHISSLEKKARKERLSQYSEKIRKLLNEFVEVFEKSYQQKKQFEITPNLYSCFIDIVNEIAPSKYNQQNLPLLGALDKPSRYDILDVFIENENIFIPFESYLKFGNHERENYDTNEKDIKKFKEQAFTELDLKFEKVLIDMPTLLFNQMIEDLAERFWNIVRDYDLNKQNTIVIGIGPSGGLLAHLMNFYKGDNDFDYDVWFLILFPFVSLEPYHNSYNGKLDESSIENIIIFDETTKTGFSCTTVPNILNRIYFNTKKIANENIHILCLNRLLPESGILNHTKGMNFHIINEAKYKKKSADKIEIDFPKYNSSDKTFNLNLDKISNYSDRDNNEIKNFINKQDNLSTILFNNNSFFFQIAKFSHILLKEEQITNKKNHFFYASSYGGRMLMFATIWLLRQISLKDNNSREIEIATIGKNYKEYEISKSNHWWFDFSIRTGETKTCFVESLTKMPIKEQQVKNLLVKNDDVIIN